ncbi:hypothetical protein D3C84_735290 [compost metagenome]
MHHAIQAIALTVCQRESRGALQIRAVFLEQRQAQLLYPAPIHVRTRRMAQMRQFIAKCDKLVKVPWITTCPHMNRKQPGHFLSFLLPVRCHGVDR